MTPKQVVTIDLKEIKTLEVRCKSCGSIISMPLPKATLSEHISCVGCDKLLWFAGTDGSAYTKVLGVLRGLSNWSAVEGAQFTLQFSLDSLDRASSEKGS